MASDGASVFFFVLVLSFVGFFVLYVFIARETTSTTVTDRADAERRARRDGGRRSRRSGTDCEDRDGDSNTETHR